MTTSACPPSPRSQRGFVLVTSLIFLVVVTLIAVSAINSSTLQEHMASNLRDKSHARQDADATLRHAELLLHQPAFNTYRPAGTCYPGSPQAGSDCTKSDSDLHVWTENQMFAKSVIDTSIAFLDPSVWANTVVQSYAAEKDSKPVEFFVEDMQSEFHPRDLNPDTAAKAQGSAIYRITARAHGQNPAAIAVTQSLYEKNY